MNVFLNRGAKIRGCRSLVDALQWKLKIIIHPEDVGTAGDRCWGQKRSSR